LLQHKTNNKIWHKLEPSWLPIHY